MPSFTTAHVKVSGQDVPESRLESFEVKSDLEKPDVAELVITNIDSKKFKLGDEVEIKASEEGSDKQETLFKGKVLGVRGVFNLSRSASVTLHAINELHKLNRERKTRTYVDQTDKQIVETIAGDYSLTAKFGDKSPTMKHAHVHQSNQTDLAFIRLRASRLNREVLVEDKNLYFREREISKGAVAKLAYGDTGAGAGAEKHEWGSLEHFEPHMDASSQVKKVTVRGWDPVKKERIVGEASAEESPLGSSGGGGSFGDTPNLDVHDVPVRSKEEADSVAKAILDERLMNFITGRAVTHGNPKIKPGTVVEIKCHDDTYNGKYYVTGVKHRYSQAGDGESFGYHTEFQFKRNAEGK